MTKLVFTFLILAPTIILATIEGTDVQCSGREGEVVRLDKYIKSKNPCIECRCIGGRISCKDNARSCPSVSGCYTLKPKSDDQCCPQCEECVVKNNTTSTSLMSGQIVTLKSDPCQVSLCYDGVLTQTSVECDIVCTGPSLPGQCCPVCSQVCRLHGRQVVEGDTVQDPLDTCRQCSCAQGSLVCRRPVCPVLSCPSHLHHVPPGACCPQCSKHRTYFQTPGHCLFRRKIYSRGEKWKLDRCTRCSCTSSLTTSCRRDPTCSTSPRAEAGARPTCTTKQGTTFQHGASWKQDKCTSCNCKFGVVDCTSPQCPSCPPGTTPVPTLPGECCPACRKLAPPPPPTEGVCTVFGDPHYKTFDGKIFNFQGSCKYLLSKDCSKSSDKNSTDSFSIRITNDARDTVAFSWLRTVTVRLGSTKVSLLQKMRVKVDGKKVNLPFIKLGVLSVMKDGYRVVLRTNEGARLLWDGVSFLELTVPSRMRGNMCGLCGNFNGDKRDDLVGRHGALLASGQEFGNSWRVGGRRACSVLPRDVPVTSPACNDDWDATIKSDKHCAAIKSNLFSSCHNRVDSQFYLKACRIDMCECPGTQCHCEVLTAYARECERAGVRISRWRDQTGCKNVKPFKYSGEHLGIGSGETNISINEVVVDWSAEDIVDDGDIVVLDTAKGLKVKQTVLPAFRPAYNMKNYDKDLPSTITNKVKSSVVWDLVKKSERRKQEQKKMRRKDRTKKRRGRKRGRKGKKKRKFSRSGGEKNSSKAGESPYNVNGYVVRKLGGEGKRRLKWGSGGRRRKEKPPPFTSLLQAVDESDYVPHSSGEIRTNTVTSGGRTSLPPLSEAPDLYRGHRRRPRRRGGGGER